MTAWGASKGEVPPLVAKMAGGPKKRILTEGQRARLIEAGGQGCPKKWRDQRAQAKIRPQMRRSRSREGDRPGREATVFIDRRVGLSGV